MFSVRNNLECRVAYEILRNADYMSRAKKEKIDVLKREVRKYVNKPISERRCIYQDEYGYYVLLYPLPDYLKELEDAEEYFEEVERVEYRPSMYDCTWQRFTTGHKIFKRNGKFYVYHSMAIDC